MKKIIFFLMCSVSTAQAAEHIWTGVGSACGDTLNLCVNNAAENDTIIIKTNEVIHESLSTGNTSVSLVAADGFLPTFGAGQNIHLRNSSGTLRIQGITMLNGKITIDNMGTSGDEARIEILRNNLTHVDGDVINIRQFVLIPELFIDINFNQIKVSGDLNTGINLFVPSAGAFSWNAKIYGNEIEISDGTWGIAINNNDGFGELNNLISGNTIIGNGRSGILIQNRGTSEARVVSDIVSNYLRGSMIQVKSKLAATGVTDAFLYNNTVIDSATGISMEGLIGDVPLRFSLANNMIINAEVGISTEFPAYNQLMMNETNLFQQVDSHNNYIVTGTNLLVSDHVLVVKPGTPRLVAGSPAIDAATFVTSGPYVDADGLYRSKLGGIDIGAFEYGDVSFKHTATGGSYTSQISHDSINGQSTTESIQMTQNATQTGDDFALFNLGNPGIWYDTGSGKWNVFNQDQTTEIENSVNFNVIHIGDSANTFEHTATGGVFPFSLLNVTQLNDDPNKIIQITQHWTGIYNNHPEGIYYNESLGNWYIYNLDLETIPDGANYNVQYQDASKSAWVHTATSDNTGSISTILDNPQINGVPCAQLQVTQSATGDVFNSHPVGVVFNSELQKWLIAQQIPNDGNFMIPPMPEGAQFHILINPQQIEQCNDLIFAHSFD